MARVRNACLPVLLFVLAACAAPATEPETRPNLGMANPASVNCVNQGGSHQVRRSASGDEYGVCVFTDGRQCDEWTLLRDKRCVAPGPTAP
ncbi:putative hemolysin [Brevundimonas lenta]|uniref:Hemolysin n=1 Tax=Brevundimonas lenta TaxID=424796 RepID=A0A7W6JAV6_9CAUL|nr:DUF333 domain-containing protein [Brevundimonas lenta]MBB4081697.1 hypothetical protein [Brevundimonas lenta]